VSDVLKDFAFTIMQSEFRARPDFVPFEGSPSTEELCIAALAAEVRALRERGEESGMIFRQLQRSAQAKDETIRELQARVKELETLADLGRLALTVPDGVHIQRGVISFTHTGEVQPQAWLDFAERWEKAVNANKESKHE
jgi:hypothetical protein